MHAGTAPPYARSAPCRQAQHPPYAPPEGSAPCRHSTRSAYAAGGSSSPAASASWSRSGSGSLEVTWGARSWGRGACFRAKGHCPLPPPPLPYLVVECGTHTPPGPPSTP